MSQIEKLLLEIHETHALLGTGQGGVEPAQVFHFEGFLEVERGIDENGVPLAALGFVAGEGVCKLQ